MQVFDITGSAVCPGGGGGGGGVAPGEIGIVILLVYVVWQNYNDVPNQ